MSFTLSEKKNSNSSSVTTASGRAGDSRGSGVGKTAKNHKFIFYGLDRPNQRGGSRTFKQKDKFIHYDVSASKSFTKTVDDIISTTSQGTSSALVGGVAAATKGTDFDATRDRSTAAIADMRAVAAAAAEVRRYRKKSRFINYGLQDEGDEPDLIVEHQQNHSSGGHDHTDHDVTITGTESLLTRGADASTCLFRLKPSHNVPMAASGSIISRTGGNSSNSNNNNNNSSSSSSSRNSVALMGVFAASPKSDIWAHFHKTVLGDQQYTDKRTGKLKWEVRYECRFENCKYVGYASKIQGSTSPLRYHYKTHVKAATEAAAVGRTGTVTAAVDTTGAIMTANENNGINAATDDVDATTAVAAAAHDDATHNINTLVADFLTKHALPPAVVDDSLFRYLLRTGPLVDGAIMNSSEMGQLLHMRRQLAGLSANVNASPNRQGAGSVGTPAVASSSSGHDNVNVGDIAEKQ
jgi:hypothetical protein